MVAEPADRIESRGSTSPHCPQESSLDSPPRAQSKLIRFEASEKLVHREEIRVLSSSFKKKSLLFFAREGWLPWSRHI